MIGKSFKVLSEVHCTHDGYNGICNKLFLSKSDLKSHQKTHNIENPPECLPSGKGFTLLQQLEQHQCDRLPLRHSGKTKSSVDFPAKKTMVVSGLLKRHHRGEKAGSSAASPPKKIRIDSESATRKKRQSLLCPLCSEPTGGANLHKLVTNIKKAHQKNAFGKLLERLTRWKNNPADIALSEAEKSSFNKLSKVHCTYPVGDRQCNTLHDNISRLKSHKRHHLGDKAYNCKPRGELSSLNIHLRDSKCPQRLLCPVCAKPTGRADLAKLVKHISNTHNENELDSLLGKLLRWRQNPESMALSEAEQSSFNKLRAVIVPTR